MKVSQVFSKVFMAFASLLLGFLGAAWLYPSRGGRPTNSIDSWYILVLSIVLAVFIYALFESRAKKGESEKGKAEKGSRLGRGGREPSNWE